MILRYEIIGECPICRDFYAIRGQCELRYFSDKPYLRSVLEDSLIVSIYRDTISRGDRRIDRDRLSIDFVCERGHSARCSE